MSGRREQERLWPAKRAEEPDDYVALCYVMLCYVILQPETPSLTSIQNDKQHCDFVQVNPSVLR